MLPGNRITPDLFLISCVSCGYIVCVTSPNIYIPFVSFSFFQKTLLCSYALQNRFFHFFLLTKQLTFSKEWGGDGTLEETPKGDI